MAEKLLRVLEFLRVLSVMVLFMVLSVRLFESSAIGSSKVFLLKADVLFYIIISKRRSHLTITLSAFTAPALSGVNFWRVAEIGSA